MEQSQSEVNAVAEIAALVECLPGYIAAEVRSSIDKMTPIRRAPARYFPDEDLTGHITSGTNGSLQPYVHPEPNNVPCPPHYREALARARQLLVQQINQRGEVAR